MSADFFTSLPLWYSYTVVILLGMVVGSFLNVCIYRLPINKSVVSPSSSCMSCGEKVRFYDNVPVLSYIVLGGKCRFCKTPLSIQYPLVEVLTGLMFFLVFYEYRYTTYTVAALVFASALIVISFIDLEHKIIPDKITLSLIPIYFVASFFIPLIEPMGSLIGMVAGGGFLFSVSFVYFSLTGREGIGFGDVKFLTMIGAFLGWQGVLVTVFLSSFFGALLGGLLIAFKGKDMKSKIPYGPFLAMGAMFYALYGIEFLDWYLNVLWKS